MEVTDVDMQIADDCASFYADPFGWVMWAFPWNQGELEGQVGPDEWQRDVLIRWGEEIERRGFNGVTPVPPIQFGITSGHGTGKSALSAWIILFIQSTRPHSKGVVTANTSDQLRTKTWGELGKWRKMCITGHWFEYNNGRGNMSIYRLGHAETWRVDAQTCREENSESFAGLHAAGSTPFYLFDEGSAIPDKIYEVAEGGKTDGEPMHFVFGNPTRNHGKFHEIFHGQKHRWITMQIDSRTAKMPNKTLMQEWIDDYGLDSDFVRVRVLGRFPKAGDMQYIPNDVVHEAQQRQARYYPEDPLILGIDCARGGEDNNMLQFRRGSDARSEKTYRIPGEKTRDSMQFVSKVIDILNRHRPDVTFVDEGAMGGPIGDRLRQLGYNVIDVNFGAKASDERAYRNKTAEMWGRMREWLYRGGAIKDHPQLEKELTDRMYSHDDKDRLVMERKKDMKGRGLASPDWADALCFEAGTMISTPCGDVPIENVMVGDEVFTPMGKTTVTKTWESFTNRITTASFSNGSQLKGKGEHKIFTWGSGITRLDALSLTNGIETIENRRSVIWKMMSLFTKVKPMEFKVLVDTIRLTTSVTPSAFFIEGFGQIISEKSRKIIMYITSMVTGETTRSPISNVSPGSNTSQCTTENASSATLTSIVNGCGKQDIRLRSGIDRQKDENGIENMLKNNGKREKPQPHNAQFAGRVLKHISQTEIQQGFVQNPADKKKRTQGASQTLASVLGAVKSLLRTVTGRHSVVPERVVTENGEQKPVYNLTLRHHNAYYANGVLVFNCLTFAQHVAPKQHQLHRDEIRTSHGIVDKKSSRSPLDRLHYDE